MGLATLGVTLREDRIAVMSCNPAIGGTAKGHLVRELDALGGEMGRIADLTGTHFKTLNESRGPAVRASRVLCEREAYAAQMHRSLADQPGLSICEAEVVEIVTESDTVHGVVLKGKGFVPARAVILTTGTFLQALMHVGDKKEIGGRLGDSAAVGLSKCLKSLGFELGRFKTGTPPRLRRASIDYARCERQPGDERPKPLSSRTLQAMGGGEPFPRKAQLVCHITYTSSKAHQIIRDNLHRSPLYQGEIVGRGPRYCPSFEDKVVRFSNRDRHQVFLEPEGVESELVYPAGLSTSMPADVQLAVLRSIEGLEDVEVVRYGYAVEYDFAPPTQLRPTLETRRIAGLYFAGQLNGTSGYEEAAFQGLLAGINAGLKVRREPELVLKRNEAHGGVLIDELVTRGVDEPFRMFTSRSEHRLRLREGNADLRLVHHGHRVGLVSERVLHATRRRRDLIHGEIQRLEQAGLAAALRRPDNTYSKTAPLDRARPRLPDDVTDEVEIEIKYAGYIAQQDRADARRKDAWDECRVPEAFPFHSVRGLSCEVLEKLEKHRPLTIGQARQVPGITPAAVSLLLIHLRRWRESSEGASRR
jgi:tRNA uridine 5-carboxymethylaminomethyl modification enzyme